MREVNGRCLVSFTNHTVEGRSFLFSYTNTSDLCISKGDWYATLPLNSIDPIKLASIAPLLANYDREWSKCSGVLPAVAFNVGPCEVRDQPFKDIKFTKYIELASKNYTIQKNVVNYKDIKDKYYDVSGLYLYMDKINGLLYPNQ